jgi:hypothetical protein
LADDHVDEGLVQSRGVTKRYTTWKSPLNVRVTPDSGKGNPLVFSVRWIFLPYGDAEDDLTIAALRISSPATGGFASLRPGAQCAS